MKINHLSLTNFRNYSRLDSPVPEEMLILAGDNAQGKTSLLEAIYFLATFTSLHAANDKQLINFLVLKEPLAVARLVGDFTAHGVNHKLEIRLIVDSVSSSSGRLKKEILIDGVKKPVSQVLGIFNAVIFLPQMTRIIEESPEERRRYLNLAIAQVNPAYAKSLSDYSKALDRRNALLKILAERGGDPSQLDYWDELIAVHGSHLIAMRIAVVNELEPLANAIYQNITHHNEDLNIKYMPAFNPSELINGQFHLPIKDTSDQQIFSVDEIKRGLLSKLKELRKMEIQRGVTTIGPHRDELRFFSNSIDLGEFGSRGQIRSLLMALKLAEVEWMKTRTGEYPVLLLDETLAELDPQRRAELLGYLSHSEQVILTTTDLSMFPAGFAQRARVWHVSQGRILKPEND